MLGFHLNSMIWAIRKFFESFWNVLSWMSGKKLLNNIHSDVFTSLLVISNEFLDYLNQNLLDFAC